MFCVIIFQVMFCFQKVDEANTNTTTINEIKLVDLKAAEVVRVFALHPITINQIFNCVFFLPA